jgi:hypothetical protein
MRGIALVMVSVTCFAVPASAQSAQRSRPGSAGTTTCSFRSATTCWNIWGPRAKPASTSGRTTPSPDRGSTPVQAVQFSGRDRRPGPNASCQASRPLRPRPSRITCYTRSTGMDNAQAAGPLDTLRPGHRVLRAERDHVGADARLCERHRDSELAGRSPWDAAPPGPFGKAAGNRPVFCPSLLSPADGTLVRDPAISPT